MGAALYVVADMMMAIASQSSLSHYDSPWGVLVFLAGVCAVIGAFFDYNFKRD